MQTTLVISTFQILKLAIVFAANMNVSKNLNLIKKSCIDTDFIVIFFTDCEFFVWISPEFIQSNECILKWGSLTDSSFKADVYANYRSC